VFASTLDTIEYPHLVNELYIKTCEPSSGSESSSLRKQVTTPQVVEIEQQPTASIPFRAKREDRTERETRSQSFTSESDAFIKPERIQ
jgi:hypothetical protein